jgi:XTP/dITP diphosphohydrolase
VTAARKIPLVLATTNAGKAREIRTALAGLPYRVLTLADVGVASAYPERGATFEANARAKSAYYSRKSGHLTLADDSGLEVEALGGAPGVRSARFSGRAKRPTRETRGGRAQESCGGDRLQRAAGREATDARNNAKLLRLLAGVPPARRGARFVCGMALARDGRVLKVVRGQVRGRIIDVPRGGLGFGYDPLFFYRPWRRTFGEIPHARKNAVSHRGRAVAKMTAFLATLRP